MRSCRQFSRLLLKERNVLIINVFSDNGEIKLPNLWLDENSNYEIGIRMIGAIKYDASSTPDLINICYDGIRMLEGPNPYTILMFITGRYGFNYHVDKPLFYPLRTNQLHFTAISFRDEDGTVKLDKAYAQLEIRKVGDKNHRALLTG